MQEITAVEYESLKKSTRNSDNNVKKFKAFLLGAIASKKMLKDKSYIVDVKEFCDSESIHKYGLTKAISKTFARGKNKGKTNPAFDSELDSVCELQFKEKVGNYEVKSLAVKIK